MTQPLAAGLVRDWDHAPTLSPLFVLQQGGVVLLVDLRAVREARGVLGHIPQRLPWQGLRTPTEKIRVPQTLKDDKNWISTFDQRGMRWAQRLLSGLTKSAFLWMKNE